MKVLSAAQVYKADQATIKNTPISSTDLMEKVAKSCFSWICNHFPDSKNLIHICCGMGNNGGDGLVIARLLSEKGYDVRVYLVHFSEKKSNDFVVNFDRLQKTKVIISDIYDSDDFPVFKSQDMVVDAIFGIGIKRPVTDFTKELIQYLNKTKAQIISIDIPSGLYPDQTTSDKEAIIRSNYTLTFQVPKLAFFMPENSDFIGSWEVLDIQLDGAYLETVKSNYYLLEVEDLKRFFKKRDTFSHKGTFGHSLIIGGSFGKIGAVILAARAALKSGSGLVSTYMPKCGYTAMQTANPEVMVEVDDEKYVQFFNFKTRPNAVGIGPGLGTHLKTKKGFVEYYSKCKIPMVIDADGLNIISEYNDLRKLIPKDTILTPHPKEFERLAGKWQDDFQKLDMLLEFSDQYKCVVVLKGAYTSVAYQGKIWFNCSGNPALATAGSGDVLTGIITSLLAQGYNCLEAALLGVFIHGRTADLAIEDNESEESFTAQDAISYLGRTFKEFE